MAARRFSILLSVSIVTLPGVAQANVGHLGELAGHSHWAGVAALAGAVAVAGAVALTGRRKRAKAAPTDEAASEPAAKTAEG